MALTAVQVRNADPGRHSDGFGLYLLVKPSKSTPPRPPTKSWVLRVQFNGRRRDFGLGSANLYSLEEARERARTGRKLAKVGINPSAELREAVPIPTFEEAAREYHKQVSKAWRKGKHGAQWIKSLEDHAFPIIGRSLVNQIDAADIQKVLLPIWLTIPETARRVRQRVGVVLDYAKGKGWRDTDAPMRAVTQLMGGIKQPKGEHFASMPYGGLPAFMARLGAGDTTVGRLALQFLILTAARSGEVRKARWREMDLEAGEWRVPAENSKTKRVHIVPLGPGAVAILGQLQGLFGHDGDELVFPGTSGMMSDATLAKALRVNGGEKYTVHGMRSTFRDWAADTGFADAWAEAALAHGNPDKTEAAYKRTTHFVQRRDKLMPAWASFALGDGSNVISLAERRA